ncbi:serine/threonine-protein kinase [Coleofasciculus sp. FACHB-542]|uniref:serine/threonine-protein kinase n=1 Tax=Coleofasciculus sp. FACHB-542 TaxID=2692787 RepID=UPI001689BA0E|nr:serine/threonine-protein kinase [Coleofasciculus sp. FACHB-542]MBD2088089.1 serine/threonine protein kinase [Coleofasciculus sp. FACHB-542]
MLGKTLSGRYYIVKHLGRGGFGQTYLAEDRQLPGNPLCVVKQLKPQATDPLTLQVSQRLFDREAQVLYKLGKHDQIPQLLAHFEQEQEFYLVQEFIEGHELKQELPVGKHLSENQVMTLCGDILKILEFVHQQEVIHRDIKPSNLIRRKQDGKIVLIDFGAVKQVSAQKTNSERNTTLTVAIGSPGYMANEQLGGKPRFCSDIYAVGMIGIQAITGIPPSQLPEDPTTSEMIWRDKVQVSQPFADVLDKMVRYDHRQRYQTATEALQALQWVNSQMSTGAYHVPPTQTLTPPAATTQPIVTSTLLPQTDPSQPQTIQDAVAELSTSSVDTPISNAGVATPRNKPHWLIGIGVGLATAFALTAGIYYFPKQNNSSPLLQISNSPSPSLQKLNNSWDRVENIALANTFIGNSKNVYSVAISPDGQTLASGGDDNTIKLWNLGTRQQLQTLKGHSDWVYSIAFSPDGQKIASSSGDGTIKVWNLHSGQLLQTLKSGPEDRVFSIAISPDGQTLASGSKDKTIKLWNLGTGQLKNTLKGHSGFILSVAIAQNGQTLVSGSDDKTIKVWNLSTGTLISTVSEPSDNGVPAVAISPDGRILATSNISDKIYLWNLQELLKGCKGAQPCSPTRTIFAHKDYVNSVAFSPDGQTLASGSRDNTIKLWNPQTGELKSPISNHSGAVNSVTFSPDGKTLVSNGEEGKIEVWQSSP